MTAFKSWSKMTIPGDLAKVELVVGAGRKRFAYSPLPLFVGAAGSCDNCQDLQCREPG